MWGRRKRRLGHTFREIMTRRQETETHRTGHPMTWPMFGNALDPGIRGVNSSGRYNPKGCSIVPGACEASAPCSTLTLFMLGPFAEGDHRDVPSISNELSNELDGTQQCQKYHEIRNGTWSSDWVGLPVSVGN